MLEIRNLNCNTEIFILLFVQVLLIVLLYLIHDNKLKGTFSLLVSNELFYKFDPKNFKVFSSFNLVGQLVYVNAISLFLTLISSIELGCEELVFNFGTNFLFFFTLQLLKVLIVGLYSGQERDNTFLPKMFYVEFSYFLSISLLLFPVFLIVYFQVKDSLIFTYVVIGVFVIIYLFRLILTLIYNKILITNKSFNIILYLCTLEILPVIFWYKMLIE